MTLADRWDEVYATKAHDQLSWFSREPEVSLRLLETWAPGGSVIDVGAGTSLLADRLVASGRTDVTVLDLSTTALAAVRARLGDRVRYVTADVRTWEPGRAFDAWHDRAVLHFLVDPDDRVRYVERVRAASARVVVIGAFAPDGPESCSGLPTVRWGAEDLAGLLAPELELVHEEREEHLTPWGAVQPFTWAVLRRP